MIILHVLFLFNIMTKIATSTTTSTICSPGPRFLQRKQKYDCVGEKTDFTITIVNDAQLTVQCHTDSYIRDTDLVITNKLKPVLNDFIVQNCSLESKSLITILQKFGAENTFKMRLDYVRNLSHTHLAGLQDMKFLTINGAQLLTKQMLTYLPNLEKLILRDARFDSNVFSNQTHNELNLKFLELSKCKVELYVDQINPVFSGLTHLNTLVVKELYFGEMKKPLFAGLSSLEELKLYQNNITSISNDSFSLMTQLRILTIYRSEIKRLPPKLFSRLYNLTNISIIDIKLESVPDQLLENQGKLKELDLSCNILKILPLGMFRSLRNLKRLVLDHNMLLTLSSDTFYGLKNVEFISVKNNLLQYISDWTFNDTYSLKELSLDNNNLSFIENLNEKSKSCGMSPLQRLSRLQILRLNNNRISKVLHDWKHELKELKSFHLSHNDLKELKEEDIDFQQSNIEIHFEYNKISSVLLKNPTIGVNLILKGNPLRCDCNIYTFARYLHNHPRSTGLKCSDPPKFANRTVWDIPLTDFTCVRTNCPATCQCIDTPGAQQKTHIICETLALPVEFNKYNIVDASLQLLRAPSTLENLSQNVKFLNLSNLNLTELPRLPQAIKLITIDLTNNKLTRVPSELLSSNGPNLLLSGNNFTCLCVYSKYIIELKKNKNWVKDYNKTRCSDGRFLESVDTSILCTTRNNTIIGGVFGVLGVILLITTAIFYKYKHNLKIKYLWSCSKRAEGNEINIMYDAFISYTNSDSRFVIEKLVPGLEDMSFKLCLHHRDWIAGEWIPTQIVRSIQESRRTIIVLSQNSMNSDWVLREFKAAHDISKRDRIPRVIIIILDDIDDQKLDPELRAYVLTRKYIRENDKLFWKKLKHALEGRRFKYLSRTDYNLKIGRLETDDSTPVIHIA